MTTTKQSMKRIHKVTIKRMIDESSDTSWLGEYGNRAESDYSIDRAHDLDCLCQFNGKQYEVTFYEGEEPTGGGIFPTEKQAEEYAHQNPTEHETYELTEQDAECNCVQNGHWNNREYRYFNPNWENYKGESDTDIRKYCEQDFTRMERLNAGEWCFIGIRAEAEHSVGTSRAGYLAQDITSGGLWGIESDSDESYFAEVEAEELADLHKQLEGIGFSKRAIAAAFKNVERSRE
jgi:hypothetical protein